MTFEIEERVYQSPKDFGQWHGLYTLKINDRIANWWEWRCVFGDERPSPAAIELAREFACKMFGKVKPLRRAPIAKHFWFSGNVEMRFETVPA